MLARRKCAPQPVFVLTRGTSIRGRPHQFWSLMKKLISVVLAGVCAQPVMGCDLCAIYAATQAQGGSGAGFFAGLAEQYTYFNTFQVDGHDVPNEGNQYLN